MQLNGTRVLTMHDFAKGLDSKGNFVDRVVDLVAKTNEMLDDVTIVEANNGTALETTVRTETPTPVWTTYYRGVPANKGSKAKIKVSCGRLASKLLVDKKLYDSAKDKDAVLLDELQQNCRGMKNEVANMLIYGLVKDNPLGFNGLFKHYCRHTCDDEQESAHYVINGLGVASTATGATTDKTALASIALVGWNPNTITCFHPENAKKGGIDVGEKRVIEVTDPDLGGDASFEAYVQHMDWEIGLAVRDYRYGGRICNIQRNLMLTKGYEGDYVELIDRLSQRVLEDGVKQAFYMDRDMWEKVSVLYSRLTRANAITFQHVEGRKERKLYGIPVRIQDCMKVAEEEVPAFA